jgi:AcrR family transcriptional regulator
MARVSTPKDGAKRAKAEMYRRLILEAAEKVFAEHGFDAAKIQDIAQAAGIALGTLYTVFPGKTEIYDAIQELRGREILESIFRSIQGYGDFLDAAMRGIDAYVRSLAARPDYLRMHLREGLSWAEREVLKSSEQVATWERGMSLAVNLLQAGIDRGVLFADNPPELQLKMMIASHQVQLSDWLSRGGDEAEVPALITRMQSHFRRAFVCEAAEQKRARPAR